MQLIQPLWGVFSLLPYSYMGILVCGKERKGLNCKSSWAKLNWLDALCSTTQIHFSSVGRSVGLLKTKQKKLSYSLSFWFLGLFQKICVILYKLFLSIALWSRSRARVANSHLEKACRFGSGLELGEAGVWRKEGSLSSGDQLWS